MECFATKGGNPVVNEEKNLCIVVDLENFYDKVDNINGDIHKIYKNLLKPNQLPSVTFMASEEGTGRA